MKKIFIAALMIAAASTSNAATKAETKAYCNGVSALAEAIMSARLAGAKPSDMFEIADKGDDSKMSRALTVAAFEEYAYQTEDHKQRAIHEFGAKYYLDCMKKAK